MRRRTSTYRLNLKFINFIRFKENFRFIIFLWNTKLRTEPFFFFFFFLVLIKIALKTISIPLSMVYVHMYIGYYPVKRGEN